MRNLIQIFFKCLLVFFLFTWCLALMSDEILNQMKKELMMVLIGFPKPQEILLPVEGQIDEVQKDPFKIYLYNTHQSEEYIDGVTVFEVTSLFAQMLRSEGFEVVFETGDFLEELSAQNKKYNQLYTISKSYLQDALLQHGPFDLIIDVHRDSASRSVSVVEYGGVEYARLMFVIGEKSENAAKVRAMSQTYSDKMNQVLSGIMREPFTRQSEYNQGVAEKMLLLEVGSDQNTSSEALRSLKILVEFLKREGLSFDDF